MEEIEELRAKAIASMPSSAKLNASTTSVAVTGGEGIRKFKYPKSREEGEVSSSEDAELATCSITQTNMSNLDESMPYTSRNNPINEVKRAPATHLSTAGMLSRSSVPQNYQKRFHKHFKRKQLPFRSLNNQALQWHAKESKNNLVISFSDDSGSDTEEYSPEKDVKRLDSTSVSCKSRVTTTSFLNRIDGMEREPKGIELTSKKGYTNHATVFTDHNAYEPSCGPQETSTDNDFLLPKKMATIKASSKELVPGQDSVMADLRLELLRNQIATRENHLKEPNKSVLQKGLTVGCDSNENGLHAMKTEARTNGIRRNAHDATSEFEANEPSKKRHKHDKNSIALNFHASCDPENETTFRAESCTSLQNEDKNLKSFVLKAKDSFSIMSEALRDRSLSENDDAERFVRSRKFSKKVEPSSLPSKHVSSVHVSNPMETFLMHERSSDHGSGNKEIYASQPNITEGGGIPFHYLVNLEELHDKELEEAQEHRCKCELEERRALIAYRKAQRTLVEANERCSFLYGKREIFSAKFRAFLMEASNSICAPNWLCPQIPHEDQFYEPDGSTSVHRDNGALDETVLPAHQPNMLTDDDGEDFNKVVESGFAHVDIQIEKANSLDNSRDYELLEASLRSELVARLGLRASSMGNDSSKKELDVEKISSVVTEYIAPSPLTPHNVMPCSEENQTAKLQDVGRTKESSCLNSAPLDIQLVANVSSSEELQRIGDQDTNNSLHKHSDKPTFTTAFSLPSSVLHTMSRHTHIIFPGYNAEAFIMKGNDCIKIKEMEVAHTVPDSDLVGEVVNFSRYAPMEEYNDVYRKSVKIDPFWPLCMFEFRGKCNDEECLWQHMNSSVLPTFRNIEHSDVPFNRLTNGKSVASRLPFSVLHLLPIPTYQIGQYIIKADSDHLQSVLAQSNWQYHQRGFCTSFSIPFSVQRILPLDSPCLQSGGDHVADYYSSDRLSLYHHSLDGTSLFKEQTKRGSCEVEQLLELALDQFDGEFCESDRMKALSLLAHAIESHPSSVLLWVVYLHIYYRNEKDIGKDDMFLHAVRHNKVSYELWLLYINSRILWKDRLNAYDRALDVLCQTGGRDDRKCFSSYVLDIFLQMVNFLCMSEHVDMAISRICGLLPCNDFGKSSGNLHPDISSCLTVSDRCLFWTFSIYFIVYEKFPESIVQQFEFVKNLSFRLDWPSAQVKSDRKELALKSMGLAMAEISSHLDGIPKGIYEASLQPLHFLAVNYVKCTATLQGSPGYLELLDKYLKVYPSCIELILMDIRSRENSVSDLKFSAFEEALHHWPKGTPGIQCLWNQYAEYALSNGKIDVVKKLMARWYQDFRDYGVLVYRKLTTEYSLGPISHMNSTGGFFSKTKDDAFGFLNLSLYWMMHKSSIDARCAIDKSLELAASEDYIHFVKEHALFATSIDRNSQKYFPGSLSSLLNRYLANPRSRFHLEPLSRKFIQIIKKPKIQQMVKNILGPISMGSTLVNSVMEAFYGLSLLPEKFNDIKAAVSFVESLMEMIPTNYELALSVYRTCSRNLIPTSSDYKSLRFWACCLLINSVFQAAPVAPEHTWLEVANLLSSSESIEITYRFHKQAISVYPFSVKLWQSYANLYITTTGDANEIIEAAQGRGIELNNVLE